MDESTQFFLIVFLSLLTFFTMMLVVKIGQLVKLLGQGGGMHIHICSHSHEVQEQAEEFEGDEWKRGGQ